MFSCTNSSKSLMVLTHPKMYDEGKSLRHACAFGHIASKANLFSTGKISSCFEYTYKTKVIWQT